MENNLCDRFFRYKRPITKTRKGEATKEKKYKFRVFNFSWFRDCFYFLEVP